MRQFGKILRLMVAHPQNFGGGVAGRWNVIDPLAHARFTTSALHILRTFCGGTSVIPQHGPPNNVAVAIEWRQSVHLAAQANAGDVAAAHISLRQHLFDRLNRTLPPIFRLLLAPQRLRRIDWVFHRDACQRLAFRVDH